VRLQHYTPTIRKTVTSGNHRTPHDRTPPRAQVARRVVPPHANGPIVACGNWQLGTDALWLRRTDERLSLSTHARPRRAVARLRTHRSQDCDGISVRKPSRASSYAEGRLPMCTIHSSISPNPSTSAAASGSVRVSRKPAPWTSNAWTAPHTGSIGWHPEARWPRARRHCQS